MAAVVDVTLYTRAECPLCEKAKAAMRAAERTHGLDLRIHEIDIDYDLELLKKFNDHVPVIYIDGAEAFRHRVDPGQFATFVKRRKEGLMRLADERCVPRGAALTRLSAEEARELSGQLSNEWRVESDHLERVLAFPDFAKALAFTNAVGAIAEKEGHHPDICLGWGKARVTISTHDVGGLSRADFVLAAKIDRVIA